MKKLVNVAIVATLVIFATTTVFVGCKKEENTISKKNIEKIKKDFQYDNTLVSYTGYDFELDDTYENPYNDIGEKHNQLVRDIFEHWDEFTEEHFIAEIFEYGIKKTYNMYNLPYDNEEVAFLVQELIESSQSCVNFTYMEMLKQHFLNTPETSYLQEFMDDIEYITYGKSMLTIEDTMQICIVEQKIENSCIEESSKNDYLLFCAVYKASLKNLVAMEKNNEYPIGVEMGVRGDRVIADATGAVRGAIAGAKAGVAGGPTGSVILGTVGAVCYGGIATAVEVGITENVSNLIDKGIDKLKSWFN